MSDDEHPSEEDIELRNLFVRATLSRKRSAEDDFLVEAVFFSDDEDAGIKRVRSRPGGSNANGRPDYGETTWGRMLRDDVAELQDHTSAKAKIFRARFRLPYPVYLKLLEWVKIWHEKNAHDASGRDRIPTELKLLGVLRVLGRSTCFDGITELSGISVSSMQTFFHKFTEWFTEKVYPKFVFTPKTKNDLVEIETAYALLGLPGALGSMDVVHFAWGMCPAQVTNLAKGKEGYPSLAYNVICDHEGRALAVLKGAYGATNDKTIVHFDGFVDDVRCDDFFTTFEYKVRTGPGATDRAMSKGAYLIIDPGYHKWAATQAASKISSDPDYVLWRTQMEAVRKDIECFFGRLKNRFRVLKTPLTFHKKRDIDNLVFTCIGLQNILHDWDKESGEITSWEVDADWLGAGGDFDDEAQTGEDDDEARHWCRPKLRRSMKNGATSRAGAKDDFSGFGSSSFPIGAWVLDALALANRQGTTPSKPSLLPTSNTPGPREACTGFVARAP